MRLPLLRIVGALFGILLSCNAFATTGSIDAPIFFSGGVTVGVSPAPGCKPILDSDGVPLDNVLQVADRIESIFFDPLPPSSRITGITLSVDAGLVIPAAQDISVTLQQYQSTATLPIDASQSVTMPPPDCKNGGQLEQHVFAAQFPNGLPTPPPPHHAYYGYGKINVLRVSVAGGGLVSFRAAGHLTLTYETVPSLETTLWTDIPKLSLATGTTPLREGVTSLFVPLGSQFSIRLIGTPGVQPPPSIKSFFSAAFSSNISPPIEASASSIWRYQCLVLYDTPQPADVQLIQAVHMGKQRVTLTPLTGFKPATIEVVVYDPVTLGALHQEFDKTIIERAHMSGIPPQVIKAQAGEETDDTFNPQEYRYEPLTTDLDFNNSKAVQQKKYLPYELDKGAYIISPDDTEFRDRYGYRGPKQDQACRYLNDADVNITIYDIFYANDGDPVLSNKCYTRQNWFANLSNQKKRADIKAGAAAVLSCPAQTVICGSYGVLQAMVSTTIDVSWWQGRNGFYNPSYLTDTPANIASRSCTLYFTPEYETRLFTKRYGTAPIVATRDAFVHEFEKMLSDYNAGPDYGDNVWTAYLTDNADYWNFFAVKPTQSLY